MKHFTLKHASQLPRRGTTIVEFALVAPLLFLIVFGAIEFSQVNMIRNAADHAAYEAARAAIVPGATAANAEAKAQAILDVVGVQRSNVTITPNPITNETVEVNARVRVRLNNNLWIVPTFFKDGVVTRNCRLAREHVQD